MTTEEQNRGKKRAIHNNLIRMFQCINSTPTEQRRTKKSDVWKKWFLFRSRVDETDVSIIIQFSLPGIIKTNKKAEIDDTRANTTGIDNDDVRLISNSFFLRGMISSRHELMTWKRKREGKVLIYQCFIAVDKYQNFDFPIDARKDTKQIDPKSDFCTSLFIKKSPKSNLKPWCCFPFSSTSFDVLPSRIHIMIIDDWFSLYNGIMSFLPSLFDKAWLSENC